MADDLGTSNLRLEREGSIAWCVIDRPGARNALTPAMYYGIKRAVRLVNTDPDLAALIITGVGDVFAPGGDLGGRSEPGDSLPGHAAEAQRLGVISRVVPHDELRAAALEAAQQILRTAPDARAHVKRMLNQRYGFIDMQTMFWALEHSPEMREGMLAFMEKRPPSWI